MNTRPVLVAWGAWVISACLAFSMGNALADTAPPTRLAVASNMAAPLADMVAAFQARNNATNKNRTPPAIHTSIAASGTLYAQMVHGAPFDLFISADTARPDALHNDGLAIAARPYAIGRLVLWQRRAPCNIAALNTADTKTRLAIANPNLAPYGVAAREVLERHSVWHAWQGRLITGQNIAQVRQFADSGAVDMALLARAQVVGHTNGCYTLVADAHHAPIVQGAALITKRARPFWRFMHGAEAARILRSYGYAPANAATDMKRPMKPPTP